MPEESLSNTQVVSLLNKMDVEQRTLEGLWQQFSVALRQVRVVIERFQELSDKLPALEARKIELETAVVNIEPALEFRKQAALAEESRFKSELEEKLGPLRKLVTQERERGTRATQDANDADKAGTIRKTALLSEIKALEDKLVKAEEGLETFKKQHGLGG